MKVTEIEDKIPDTTGFITTPEFIRLTELSFGARMKEVTKNFATKSKVTTALNLGEENKQNKKTSVV